MPLLGPHFSPRREARALGDGGSGKANASQNLPPAGASGGRAGVLDSTSSTLAAFTNPPGADSVARSAPEGGTPRTARHSAADAVGSAQTHRLGRTDVLTASAASPRAGYPLAGSAAFVVHRPDTVFRDGA